MLRILFIVFLGLCTELSGQYFQQKVDHQFSATLDTAKSELMVNQTIFYYNNAEETLDTIYFHLWANAFSSLESDFAKQQLQLQSTDFYFSKASERGGFRNLEVRGSEVMQVADKAPDLGFIVLEKPLKPGEKKEIIMDYILDIPARWNRLGHYNGDIHLMHWYPKPAVYDEEGWHWFPYLTFGEFYSDYGDYHMEVVVPEGMLIASTGSQIPEKSEDAEGEYKYKISAEKVIDLAIVASFDLQRQVDSYQSISGEPISLEVYQMPENQLWSEYALEYLKESIKYYEEKVGAYPYPQLSLVDSRRDCKCGMEYPMLITVSAESANDLAYYINHEVGHQWFYGVLGFNERVFPYLDEGLTTFYEHQYTYQKTGSEYHTNTQNDLIKKDAEMPLLMYAYALQKRRRYSESPSEDPRGQSFLNYGLNAYERAAYAYSYLAGYIGQTVFEQGIKDFYQEWSFKHPDVEDLINSLEGRCMKSLEWFIPLLTEDITIDFAIDRVVDEYMVENLGNATLPFQIGVDTAYLWMDPLSPGATRKITNPWGDNIMVNPDFLGFELDFNDNSLKNNLDISYGLVKDHSQKNELLWLPILLYNSADGFQLGSAFYNSTVPPKDFQFLINPNYAFSSKQLTGNAWMAYNQYFDSGRFRKIQWRMSAKRFSDFYSETNDYRTQYLRLTPQVSFHFRKDPSQQTYSKITARGIVLNTENAMFSGPGEFVIHDNWNQIFQLRYDYFDFRVINRKEWWLMLEQQLYEDPFGESQDYLKATTAFKFWTPYAKGRSFGFRFFGSAFLRNTQRQSSSYNSVLSRGSIALLHQGFNDYQYEDYYLNRQGNAGSATNQISYAGGGFKDAVGPQYQIGMSNDWAVSVNMYADLPIPLPTIFKLKPYVDVGYYRTKSTLNDPLSGKTLVSGGLMLSYLDGGFEIYLPIFASQAISNIYSENNENLFRRISFSIDLHRLNPWDLQEDLNF